MIFQFRFKLFINTFSHKYEKYYLLRINKKTESTTTVHSFFSTSLKVRTQIFRTAPHPIEPHTQHFKPTQHSKKPHNRKNPQKKTQIVLTKKRETVFAKNSILIHGRKYISRNMSSRRVRLIDFPSHARSFPRSRPIPLFQLFRGLFSASAPGPIRPLAPLAPPLSPLLSPLGFPAVCGVPAGPRQPDSASFH